MFIRNGNNLKEAEYHSVSCHGQYIGVSCVPSVVMHLELSNGTLTSMSKKCKNLNIQ